MGIFGKKHPNFFSPKEEKEIVSAIKSAEKTTSGEVRVHLDEDEVDDMKERAVYIFDSLGMKNTEARNGILIYLHPSQKNFLVMGDEGIHAKVGQEFWENISKDMKTHFQKEEFALLKKEYEAADKDYQALTSCADAEEKLMEIQMYLEQVKELIDTNDFETAGDAMPFVREAQAGLNELKEPCGVGGGEQVEEIREEDMIEEPPQEEAPQEAPSEEAPQEETPE